VPRELRDLHGNPRQHAVPTDVPEGEGVLCEAPEWMDEEQRLQWDYSRAVAQVRANPQVVRTKEGNAIQNAYIGIVNRQAAMMMRAGAEMGFSPAARMSLGLSGEQSSGHSARYIGGRRAKASRLDEYLNAKPDRLG
jgi:hypothetical protein